MDGPGSTISCAAGPVCRGWRARLDTPVRAVSARSAWDFAALTAARGAVLSHAVEGPARSRAQPSRPPSTRAGGAGFARLRMAAPAPRPSSDRPLDRSLVLGVLGGIAAGKSAVARLLAGRDGVVISADELARAALDSPAVLARVRERFGAAAIGPDGRADRAFLARAVFDPARGAEHRAALESWTHPLVRDRIMERLS